MAKPFIPRFNKSRPGDRGVRREPSQIIDGKLVLGKVIPRKPNIVDSTIEGLVRAATYIPRQAFQALSGNRDMQAPTPSGASPKKEKPPSQKPPSQKPQKADDSPKTTTTPSREAPAESPKYSWDGTSKPKRPNATDYKSSPRVRPSNQYNIDLKQYQEDMASYKSSQKQESARQSERDSAGKAKAWDAMKSAIQGKSQYTSEYDSAIANAWKASGGKLSPQGKPTGKLNGLFFYQYGINKANNPFK